MKIGILGFGRLGKLISRYLVQDSELFVHDPITDYSKEIKMIGARKIDLEEIGLCDIIIPCVPISNFEQVIKDISPFLKEGSLVIDVCSVKTHPVEVMLKNLPSNISILATHPMFGPDSAAKTLYGSKIVLCPIRIKDEKYHNIKSYLETHGLLVLEATPEEHDKQISSSLLLTHFIGRTLMKFGAKSLDIDTKGYRRLIKILETVENDSWQLFVDMNVYNPYSKETREIFIKSLKEINEDLP